MPKYLPYTLGSQGGLLVPNQSVLGIGVYNPLGTVSGIKTVTGADRELVMLMPDINDQTTALISLYGHNDSIKADQIAFYGIKGIASDSNLLPDCSSFDSQTNGLTISSANTTLISINLGTVGAGSVFIANASFYGTKGATDGDDALTIDRESGTAAVRSAYYSASSNRATITRRATAGVTSKLNCCTLFRVTTGGTLVLKAYATASGSNTTSVYAAMLVEFLKKF